MIYLLFFQFWIAFGATFDRDPLLPARPIQVSLQQARNSFSSGTQASKVRFRPLYKDAVEIASNGEQVWVIDKTGSLWSCDSTRPTCDWKKIRNSKYTEIGLSKDLIVGFDYKTSKFFYCHIDTDDCSDSEKWKEGGSGLSRITLSKKNIYAINLKNELVYSDTPGIFSKISWYKAKVTNTIGRILKISVSPSGRLHALNLKNELFMLDQEVWYKIPSEKLRDLSAGSDGIWGVSEFGTCVYCAYPCKGDFISIPRVGPLERIFVEHSLNPFALSKDGSAMYFYQNFPQQYLDTFDARQLDFYDQPMESIKGEDAVDASILEPKGTKSSEIDQPSAPPEIGYFKNKESQNEFSDADIDKAVSEVKENQTCRNNVSIQISVPKLINTIESRLKELSRYPKSIVYQKLKRDLDEIKRGVNTQTQEFMKKSTDRILNKILDYRPPLQPIVCHGKTLNSLKNMIQEITLQPKKIEKRKPSKTLYVSETDPLYTSVFNCE